jgi:hypothetical protein
MTDTKYNGWTNYATWRVNLELLDGLQLSDLFYDEDSDLNDVYDVSKELKAYVDGAIEIDEGSQLVKSYAYAFLDDVNWMEIAQHKLDAENENNFRR